MKKLTVILLCMILLLTGCKSKAPSNPPKTPPKPTEPKIVVSEQVLQTQLLSTLAAAEDDTEQTPGYILEMDARRTVKVLSFQQVANDHVDAVVSVASPDLYGVIKALESESFESEEDIDAALTEGVKAAELISKEVTLAFYWDEEWEPSLTDEFMDACYGGILTLRQEYYAQNAEGVE